jgi:uncharacterized membrane protein YdfJ with MMPL/SSD domain
MFDALAAFTYRARWLIVPLGVVLLVASYAGKDVALSGLSNHLGSIGSSESARAGAVLARNLAHVSGDLLIVFDARSLSARGATRDQYARLVRDALAPIQAAINANAAEGDEPAAGVPIRLRTFFAGGTPFQIGSNDPHVTVAFVDLAGDTVDEKKKNLREEVLLPLQTQFRTLADSDPQFREQFSVDGSRRRFRIYVTGGIPTSAEAALLSKEDAHRADRISLPLTLIMLVVIFGGVVAAVQPLLVGFLAAGVAVVVLGAFGRLFSVSSVAGTLTSALGLGLAIDYSLLLVTRFREEMRRTEAGGAAPDTRAALTRTLNTAGRSVLFSGVAVTVGMTSLAFIPLIAFRSLSVAGAVTVIMAVAGALLVLPAVLAIVGRDIDRFNVLSPFRGRRPPDPDQHGFFHALAEFVVRFPLPIATVTIAVLVVVALPAFRMRLGTSDYRILPADSDVRRGYAALVSAFGTGAAEPVKIAYQDPDLLTPDGIGRLWDYVHTVVARQPGIARGPDGLPAVESAVTVLDARLVGLPQAEQRALYAAFVPAVAAVQDPRSLRLPDGAAPTADELGALLSLRDALIKGDTALIQASPAADPQSDGARDLVRALRDHRPPPPATALVGGTPASSLDYVDAIEGRVPLIVLFIFLLTYMVLWGLLGSVTLPVIAFVLNVISLGASFGALVFIFQEGHLARLLDFTALGVLDATTPVTLFAVTFGLSMDYQVFLLSRIKEEYDRTGDVTRGIVGGLARTAGIITGAAATLLMVLGAYATAQNALVKSLAVGMFVAVLVDATIVRTFLVPAVLKLVGRPAWYSPAGLHRAWQRLGLAERG